MEAANTAIATEGEHGFRPTRIAIELNGDRARINTLDQGYFLAGRPLQISGRRVRLALVGVHLAMLAGDVVDMQIHVGAGTILEVIEPTGMVAYDAQGRHSVWRLSVAIGTGATLIWHGAEFVAAQGSSAHRNTKLVLEPGARALLKETLVLGRSGESHIRLLSRMHISLDGQELLVEELALTPEVRRLPGIVGTSKAISTVIAAGWRPDGERADPHWLDLEEPGAIYRSLDTAAHRAERVVAPVFEHWRGQVLTRGP